MLAYFNTLLQYIFQTLSQQSRKTMNVKFEQFTSSSITGATKSRY